VAVKKTCPQCAGGVIETVSSEECPECKGRGKFPGEKETCDLCLGTGELESASERVCRLCYGKGFVTVREHENKICPTCLGKGNIGKTLCDQCKGQGVIKI
jgi:DnaJ-class molecular chaperone